MVLDWNSSTALPQRANLTFFVPCYFLAFPPYRSSGGQRTNTPTVIDVVNGAEINKNTCPQAYYASTPSVDATLIEGEGKEKRRESAGIDCR